MGLDSVFFRIYNNIQQQTSTMKLLQLVPLLSLPIGRGFLAPAIPLASSTKLRMATKKSPNDLASNVLHSFEDFLGSINRLKKDVFDKGRKTVAETEPEQAVDDSWISQEFEEKAPDLPPDSTAKATKEMGKTSRLFSDRNDWIARDMEEAGKTGNDWVEKDMKAMGRDTSLEHSVREDMEKYGNPSNEEQLSSTRHHDTNKSQADIQNIKRNQDLEKDMKVAGQSAGGFDWLRQEMQAAGKVFSTSFVDDRTKHAIEAQKDHSYNDVMDDMKQRGKADSQEWVAQDMERLGHAHGDPDFKHEKDFSYPVDQQMLDHYKVEDIAKDMTEAGHSSNTGGVQDNWIRRDMEQVGKSHDHVIANIASAMKKKKLRYDIPFDIREDMELIGKLGNDASEWIAHDMERAGHEVENRIGDHGSTQSTTEFRDKEVQEVMAMRKPLVVDYVEQQNGNEEKKVGLVGRIWSSARRPWKGFLKGLHKSVRLF